MRCTKSAVELRSKVSAATRRHSSVRKAVASSLKITFRQHMVPRGTAKTMSRDNADAKCLLIRVYLRKTIGNVDG